MLTVILVVFLLPRMHERYFYLGVCLIAVLAVRVKRFVLPFALLELATLSRLVETGIPLRISSLMVLTPERKAAAGENPT